MGSFALGRSTRNSLNNAAGTGRRIAASMPGLGVTVMVLALALLTLLLGAVVALGALKLTFLVAGLIIVIPFALFTSSQNMLPMLFVAVFVIQGLGQYFLQMRLLTWMATGMSALLFGRAILELYFVNRRELRPQPGAGRVIAAASLYLAFFFFSLSLGSGTPLQVVSAVRFVVPMFGVLFAMYWFQWSTGRLEGIWWLIVAIMVLQLPFVVYQHFFMMATHGWDGVVGTMGTNLSPMLVVFSLAAALFMVARWSHGLTSTWKTALTFAIFLAIVLLGEVKAVVVWIPLGMLIVLRRRVLRNVMAFATFCIFITLFVVSTFTVYQALYWGEGGSQGDSITEKFDSTSGYILDADGVNYRTGEVSRMASMALWYSDPVPTVVERLVGYGPGASANNQGTGQGIVSRRYGILQLNASVVSYLLWDTGILGAVAFAMMLLTTIVTAWKLSSRQDVSLSPESRAIADASFAVVCLITTTVVYNRSLMDEPTSQLLFFFCAGCIVQLTRFPRGSAGHDASEVQIARVPASRLGPMQAPGAKRS